MAVQHPVRRDVTRRVNHTLAFTSMADILVDAYAAPAPRSAEFVAAIYDAHQRELFSFALRSCRDREVAEDLVHESFVRLLVEVDAGREPTNTRAWLYRVIANLAVSRGRRATVAQRQLGELLERRTESGPEPLFLESERRSDLEAVLGELGADARTALLMAANGFNGIEIAEAIGRSGNATRSLMCRARLQLRERLSAMEAFS
jgi:RNA polymerase sigma-70 factor (ECF subfamily)